jgi:hypothetical protein
LEVERSSILPVMKILAALLLLAVPTLASAIEIHRGDSLADVRSALGTPRGQAKLGDRLVLFYDDGQVQLVDDRVTRSDFLSPEELATQQAEDARIAQLRSQRISEGEALKAKKLADPAFASAPPAYQVTFWEDFQQRYPEVSCDDEYHLALARRQEQLEEEAHDQSATDLEARVANAEDNAAQAEQDALQARSNGFFSWPGFLGFGHLHHNHERPHTHERDHYPPKMGSPAPSKPHDSSSRNLMLLLNGPFSTPPSAMMTNSAGFTLPLSPSLGRFH